MGSPATINRLREIARLWPDRRVAPAARIDAIRAARSEGHTFAEIGDALGITRQAVHQLLRGAK